MRRNPTSLRGLGWAIGALVLAASVFELWEFLATGHRPGPLLVGSLVCSLLVATSSFALDRHLKGEGDD